MNVALVVVLFIAAIFLFKIAAEAVTSKKEHKCDCNCGCDGNRGENCKCKNK